MVISTGFTEWLVIIFLFLAMDVFFYVGWAQRNDNPFNYVMGILKGLVIFATLVWCLFNV